MIALKEAQAWPELHPYARLHVLTRTYLLAARKVAAFEEAKARLEPQLRLQAPEGTPALGHQQMPSNHELTFCTQGGCS